MEQDQIIAIAREAARESAELTFNRLMKENGRYFKNKKTKVSLTYAHNVTGISRAKIIQAVKLGEVDGDFVAGAKRGTWEVKLSDVEKYFGLH